MRYGGIPDTQGRLTQANFTDSYDGQPSDIILSTHQRWRLCAVHAQLSTGLAVATRRLRLEIREGTTILLRIDCRATQRAATTRDYYFAPNIRDATAFINNTLQTPLPSNLLLSPGQTIGIAYANGQIDDAIQASTLLAEEWVDG